MTELIERLKAAPHGSRELDCAIFEAIDAPKSDFMGRKVTDYTLPIDGWYGVITDDGYLHLNARKAPNYTTSIDAALLLVRYSAYQNLAAFLHSVTFQSTIGDIPDQRIALEICKVAMRAAREANTP